MTISLRKIVLIIGDLLMLHLALFLTLAVRYLPTERAVAWQRHWPHFLVVFFIWLVIFYAGGLYNLNIRALGREFWRLFANSLLAASALSIAYFYLNVQTDIAPKTNLAIWSLFSAILLCSWRYLYQVSLQSLATPRKLAIIGSAPQIAAIHAALAANPGTDYRLALSYQNASELTALAADLKSVKASVVVIGDDFGGGRFLQETLFACLNESRNETMTFFKYPDFYELLTSRVTVEALTPSWFLENLREGQKNYFNILKRGVDIVGALIILAVSLPFWPLIAGMIKITSRGRVIFYQTRFGQNGRTFQIIKFRTMRTENNDLSPTAARDARITKCGSFLRRTRLDEIPQAINILKNEMSFIGPRPERPEIAAELEKLIPFYRTRLLIKPGLTGWDQVSGDYHSASPEDSLLKLQRDLFYLKHRSPLLDLDIALRTLATIMSRQGQ